MINFFKRLFAAIFGKKTTVTPSIKPLKEEIIVKSESQSQPKKSFWERQTFFPFTGTKKWQMRNNRLHIEYNGSSKASGTNYTIQRIGKRGKLYRAILPGSMYKGKIDSLKCNRLERAEEIIRSFRSSIERAVFTDKEGNQHQLI